MKREKTEVSLHQHERTRWNMKVSGFILHTSPYHMTPFRIMTHSESLQFLKVTEPWPGAQQPSWCYLEIDRSSSALPADRSGRCGSMAPVDHPRYTGTTPEAVIEMWTWPLYPRNMSILESWKMENGNNINKYEVSYNSNIAIYHKPFM